MGGRELQLLLEHTITTLGFKVLGNVTKGITAIYPYIAGSICAAVAGSSGWQQGLAAVTGSEVES